jgi:hypothetical protein
MDSNPFASNKIFSSCDNSNQTIYLIYASTKNLKFLIREIYIKIYSIKYKTLYGKLFKLSDIYESVKRLILNDLLIDIPLIIGNNYLIRIYSNF